MVFDAASVQEFAEVIKAISARPVQRMHRDILDLLEDHKHTIGDFAPKLAERLNREDTEEFRRQIRDVAEKDCGIPLKRSRRGRRSNSEKSSQTDC